MVRKFKSSSPPSDGMAELKQQLLAMDINEIMAFAVERDIDIGGATTQQGIYKKILAHMEASR